jgi:hypothetical protein
LHSERAIAVVEPWSLRTLVLIAAGAAACPLALTVVTPLAGDIAMVGIAGAIAGLGGWAVRVRRWLDDLPMEIAPVVATGRVDGVTVYRFRVRLGRGRPLKEVSATVRAEDQDGAVIQLPTLVAGGTLTGPFTVVAHVPPSRALRPQRFDVDVSGTAGGRRWNLTRRLDAGALRAGRFGGIESEDGRVRFDDWVEVVPDPSQSSDGG